MKKLAVWFILVSFMNLTGCFSRDLVSPSSYKFDERKEIKIITKDTTYNFKGYHYILLNDTLVASEKNIFFSERPLDESSVKVPVDEMLLVEVSRVDGGKTTLFFVGGLVVVYLLVAVVSLIKLTGTPWKI